jgi:hypothetical protein
VLTIRKKAIEDGEENLAKRMKTMTMDPFLGGLECFRWFCFEYEKQYELDER